MRPTRAWLLILVGVLAGCAPNVAPKITSYGYRIVHEYPHDSTAFTEGLLYHDGFLYEGTGLNNQSFVRKVRLETGEVVQQRVVPEQYFGEGIVIWKDRLLELTYLTGRGFVYDLATFAPRGEFGFTGDGWALTTDGKRILMSDGTSELRFLDPETLRETAQLRVTEEGRPVTQLNELEWVKGEIFANVWHSNRIARIDPESGRVTGWIELAGLMTPGPGAGPEDVLNGIAYDATGDRLFVTGKRWPKVFEIRALKR